MSSNNNYNNNFFTVDNIRDMNHNIMPTSLSSSVYDAWDNWEKAFSEEKYLEVSINNGIPTVLTSNLTQEMTDAIEHVLPVSAILGPGNNYPMACTACRNQLSLLMRMRDSNGRPFFMTGPKEHYPAEFITLWNATRTGATTSVLVVNPSQFGMFSTGKWNHFSVGTATSFPAIKDAEKRQRLLDKYIPIATNLFTKNGVPGIHTSLDTLIENLPNIEYGGKLLTSAIWSRKLLTSAIWFRKHITENFENLNRLAQLNILTAAIFDLSYCTEIGSGDVTLPLYHQLSKNTLDTLVSCDNISQLTSLLKVSQPS